MTETECIGCGSSVAELDPDAMETSDGLISGSCLESDAAKPMLTVFFGDDQEPSRFGLFHDETEGTFSPKYVKIDARRGYFEAISDIYTKIHDDVILSMLEDAEELEPFDTKLREYCEKLGIHYARVFATTSNVFSCGYEFWIANVDLDKFTLLIPILALLKATHRDERRFRMEDA